MDCKELFFAFIRNEACGDASVKLQKEELSTDLLSKLYKLARLHDMAHLVANALSPYESMMEEAVREKFRKQKMLSFFRYETMNYEFQQVSALLEQADLPFIPLKGTILREDYPQPWMRTSCDIDIFVDRKNLDRAINLLVDQLSYRVGEKWTHDVALYSPSGVHIELHFNLVEDGRFGSFQTILPKVWEYTRVREGYRFFTEMTDDMFYFYHIAHMAKHFEIGGCGVRSFLDVWILNHRREFDREKREALLREGGLLTFAQQVEQLADFWFSGVSGTETVQRLENFVLRAGVYGTTENMVALGQAENGGKALYVLHRIFLPYSALKEQYPIIIRRKWLTPFCQVIRWFRLVFRGGVKQSINELNVNTKLSDERVKQISDLMNEIGLEK